MTAAYSSVFGVSGLMFTFFELLHRHGATIPALFAGFAVWSLCIAINSGILHSDRPYRLNETLTWEGLARFRWREDGVDKFQQDGKLKPTVDASAKAVVSYQLLCNAEVVRHEVVTIPSRILPPITRQRPQQTILKPWLSSS